MKLPTSVSIRTFSSFLIYVLIFLLPTQLGKHFFPPFTNILGVRTDYPPVLYLTDIIVLLLLVGNIKPVISFFKSKYIALVILLSVVNIFFSLSAWMAVYKFIKMIELAALYAVIRSYRPRIRLLLITFLAGSLVQLGLAVAQFSLKHSVQGIFYFLGERFMTLSTPNIAKSSLDGIEFLRPYGSFSHPNSLAGFYLALYIFVLTFAPFNRFIWIKHALLLVCSMLIFISFSKIAIGAFVLLNIYYLLSQRTTIACTLCFVARLVVLIIVALVFYAAQGDHFTLDKRIMLAEHALAIFTSNPLWGVGWGNYILAEAQYPNRYLYFFVQPVHNIILLLLAETGLLLGGLLLYRLYLWAEERFSDMSFRYVFFAVFITGMFDHYWLTLQQNMLLMAVLFGILAHTMATSYKPVPRKQGINQ